MFNKSSAMSVAVAAFMCLLIAFVSLGILLIGLADGSAVAPFAGVALVVFLTAAVIGFRLSAVRLARARRSGGVGTAAGVFGVALRRDEVDRYLQTYRGAH